MSGTVSTRWYWSDWMSDPGLRACGYAARGLWKDMLCIAAANKGRDYGFLILNGNPLDADAIAKMTGGKPEEVVALLTELDKNGVFSRDRRKAIYCRRMVRAEKNRGNGRAGGNPNLIKNKDNPKSVEPDPKPLLPEPEPDPEARSPNGPKQEVLFDSASVDGHPLDPEADLYRRGKQVLGSNAGGMIKRLLTAKGGNVALARAAIETAATKGDPRQFVGAMIRGPSDARPSRGGGMAQVHRMLRGGYDASDASS